MNARLRGNGPRLLVALLALLAIGLSLQRIAGMGAGLQRSQTLVGSIPITVLRPATAAPVPVVVIAHGFAGSQQLMQPFATTLARNGYMAVSFDFPGHGANAVPLAGGMGNYPALQADLLASLDAVSRHALALPGSDGRIAVLGHSMAAEIVVRHAQTHPEVAATIAVSLFLPQAETHDPPNLLIIDGALEAEMLISQARGIVGRGERAEAQTTYGSFADHSARRLALSPGMEHIGVLYGREGLDEARRWLDQAFGRSGSGFVDTRGRWIGLLLLGLISLAWPLSALLPRVNQTKPPEPAAWKSLLLLAILPALLTPLLLWKVPGGFLPLLLGDYLALHFALYGLLTTVGLFWLRRRGLPREFQVRPLALLTAVVLMSAYSLLAIGVPLDRYVSVFLPHAGRPVLIAALFAGTLPYFLADEWLTRRLAPRRGAYALTKLCFLVSLSLAVALNLERLFFLVIIVPAILLLFVVYGLFSRWVLRATGEPWVAATSNALLFAWFIAVTFPVVQP